METNIRRINEGVLTNTNNALIDIQKNCADILELLPGLVTPQIVTGLDTENPITYQFINTLYEPLLLNIFENLEKLATNFKMRLMIERLVVVDGGDWKILRIVLETLGNCLNRLDNKSKEFTFVLDLLKKVVKSDLLESAIIRAMIGHATSSEDYETASQWLVSLESRVANKTQGKKLEFFSEACMTCLFKHVARVFAIMDQIYKHTGKKFANESFTCIVGKLLTSRGPKINILLCAFGEVKLWMLVKQMTKNLNANALEIFVWALMNHCKNSVDVWCHLGNLVLESEHLRFLITRKWTVLSFYDTEQHPQLITNLIGYLMLVSSQIVLEVFEKLLEIWSARHAIHATCVPQRMYISELIVYCAKRLDCTNLDKKFRKFLLDGVSAHLDCGQEEVRALGMACAELLVPIIVSPKVPLEFDYSVFQPETMKLVERLKGMEIVLGEILPAVPEEPLEKIVEDLDSDDDDFVPYAIVEEEKENEKSPKFIRALMTGLADKTDTEQHELCKKSAMRLIREQMKNEDIAIANELIDLLVDLNMIDETVETVCAAPVPCARHLMTSFRTHRSMSSHLQTLHILDRSCERLYHENRLLPVADEIFCDLMGNHGINDNIFIAKLIHSLMRVCLFGMNAPACRLMQYDLFHRVYPLKRHYDAEVRFAVVSCIVALLSLNGIEDQEEVVDWLEQVAEFDPDERVRNVAARIF